MGKKVVGKKEKKERPLKRKQFTLEVRAITTQARWDNPVYKASLQATLEERITKELADVKRVQLGNTQWFDPVPTDNGLVLIKAVVKAINKP